MLILTRKQGESLYIGDKIKVTLLQIQGKQAKFGIDLPDEMTVYREEIYNLVADENKLSKHSERESLNHEIAKVEIETRLGIQKISQDKIISFPKGLIGYDNQQNYTLLPLGENSPFFLLQSTDSPELGLIVTDPYLFLDDYSVKISDAEQKIIDLKSSNDLLVFVTVTIPAGQPEQACLNLSGPIFVNFENKKAMQIPQDVKTPRINIADCLKG